MAIRPYHSLRARLYIGTTAEWSASTTVYRAASMLLDSTTGALKIADGSSSYGSLAFVTPSSGSTNAGAFSVINKTGSDIAADKLVCLSGLDATSGKPKIILADADVAGSDDIFVTTAAIANNASGVVVQFALSAANLDTSGATTAGDPVYLSAATAGAFAHTAPSGDNDRVEPVGFVVVKDAAVGQIRWLMSDVRTIGTDQIQPLAVTQAKIAAAALDGTIAKVSGNADVIGALPVVFRVNIADASADTDVVSTHKIRVLKFEFLNTGIAAHAANDTVQLKNGASAITDAVAKTATVNKLVAASTYDPAQVEVAAAGTLRITAVKDTNVAGVAIITAVRVA
jgi:hypothetical protein